jgi:hypothetical protein
MGPGQARFAGAGRAAPGEHPQGALPQAGPRRGGVVLNASFQTVNVCNEAFKAWPARWEMP